MSESPHQSDVDPLTVVLEWVKGHPQVLDLLGDPAHHVSGIYEAPWPHLVVSEGVAADLRDGSWEGEYEIAFHLIGHPNGAPGKATLRGIAAKVMRLVCSMPEAMNPTRNDPVVSKVTPSGGYVYQPLASGQPSYHFAARVTVRPPSELLAP